MAQKDKQLKAKGVFVLAGLEYNSISLVVECLDSYKVIRDMDHYCNSNNEITSLKYGGYSNSFYTRCVKIYMDKLIQKITSFKIFKKRNICVLPS